MLLEDLVCLSLTPPAHCISQSYASLLTVEPNEHVLVILSTWPLHLQPPCFKRLPNSSGSPFEAPGALSHCLFSWPLVWTLLRTLTSGLLTPSHSNRLKYVCPKLKSTLFHTHHGMKPKLYQGKGLSHLLLWSSLLCFLQNTRPVLQSWRICPPMKLSGAFSPGASVLEMPFLTFFNI